MDEADQVVAGGAWILNQLSADTVKLAYSATYTEHSLKLLRAHIGPPAISLLAKEATLAWKTFKSSITVRKQATEYRLVFLWN